MDHLLPHRLKDQMNDNNNNNIKNGLVVQRAKTKIKANSDN